MKIEYLAPGGRVYDLYLSMLDQPHLLIAGATGSGKSVCINGIVSTAIRKLPTRIKFILIDPKRVELVGYKLLPHTIRYASEPDRMIQALEYTLDLIERRYSKMQGQGKRKWESSDIYVIIDELADLMTTQRKRVQPLLQRIAQIGRAARVHLIVATQCPLSKVIPTEIKVNFDARVGLRTRNAQDSRNILGVKGCETLPRYGEGFYLVPEGMTHTRIPMIPESELQALIDWWIPQRPPRGFFAKRKRERYMAQIKKSTVRP